MKNCYPKAITSIGKTSSGTFRIGCLLYLFILLSLTAMAQEIHPTDIYPVHSSIRALEVVDDQQVWFAGSGGTYGYTRDGGSTWTIDSLSAPDGSYPEFRALSVTGSAVFLLSVASPALLYRSQDLGKSWELVYQNDDADVFFDAMIFRDEKFGVAVGDPLDGCLIVLITHDGGTSWSRIPCTQLPGAADGEGCFAASNSNIAIAGKHIWLVSGGPVARVYHSSDEGRSWTYQDSPILQGGKMTGIFSIDIYNKKNGFIIGGDWENMTLSTGNKAMTSDGGQTWTLVAEGRIPGYRSCVRYVPKSHGKRLYAVGIPGISYSQDGGRRWREQSKDSFYTIRFTPDGKTAWMAGQGRVARFTVPDK